MATTLDLSHNHPQVLDVLDGLLNRLDDLSAPMALIAAQMESAAERAFDEEADPATGEPWADLSDVTKARREKAGHWPGSILQVKGQLAASIESDYGKDFAQVGSNKVYAPVMFFGAEKGAFGKNKRGGPIPWGNIPARPFLGLNADDEADILDILETEILSNL
ncbi:MAG: phage virion morphogenesis protein [Comamonas sp.]